VRLHLNENTAGASPVVSDAIKTMTRLDLARYPDYQRVTSLAARYFGVDPDWVVLTNGLDEGLHAVAQAAAVAFWRGSGDRARPANSSAPPTALVIEPAFEMYRQCAEAAGFDVVAVLPNDDLTCSLRDARAAVTPETRLAYLNDPNNPTGQALGEAFRDGIVDAAPKADILLDEAYAEFSGRTAIGPLLQQNRRIMVGRTFSKAFGLAGLRAGALVAHPDSLAPIRRALPPYNLNTCATRALEAALSDLNYVAWYVAQVAVSRALIAAGCGRLGLMSWPSEANFVLIRIGDDVSAVVRQLADRGVQVRDRSSAAGCQGCLRLTAGIAEHTQIALNALEDVLETRRR
jgi:histidinol-phosphate aminotransferase